MVWVDTAQYALRVHRMFVECLNPKSTSNTSRESVTLNVDENYNAENLRYFYDEKEKAKIISEVINKQYFVTALLTELKEIQEIASGGRGYCAILKQKNNDCRAGFDSRASNYNRPIHMDNYPNFKAVFLLLAAHKNVTSDTRDSKGQENGLPSRGFGNVRNDHNGFSSTTASSHSVFSGLSDQANTNDLQAFLLLECCNKVINDRIGDKAPTKNEAPMSASFSSICITQSSLTKMTQLEDFIAAIHLVRQSLYLSDVKQDGHRMYSTGSGGGNDPTAHVFGKYKTVVVNGREVLLGHADKLYDGCKKGIEIGNTMECNEGNDFPSLLALAAGAEDLTLVNLLLTVFQVCFTVNLIETNAFGKEGEYKNPTNNTPTVLHSFLFSALKDMTMKESEKDNINVSNDEGNCRSCATTRMTSSSVRLIPKLALPYWQVRCSGAARNNFDDSDEGTETLISLELLETCVTYSTALVQRHLRIALDAAVLNGRHLATELLAGALHNCVIGDAMVKELVMCPLHKRIVSYGSKESLDMANETYGIDSSLVEKGRFIGQYCEGVLCSVMRHLAILVGDVESKKAHPEFVNAGIGETDASYALSLTCSGELSHNSNTHVSQVIHRFAPRDSHHYDCYRPCDSKAAHHSSIAWKAGCHSNEEGLLRSLRCIQCVAVIFQKHAVIDLAVPMTDDRVDVLHHNIKPTVVHSNIKSVLDLLMHITEEDHIDISTTMDSENNTSKTKRSTNKNGKECRFNQLCDGFREAFGGSSTSGVSTTGEKEPCKYNLDPVLKRTLYESLSVLCKVNCCTNTFSISNSSYSSTPVMAHKTTLLHWCISSGYHSILRLLLCEWMSIVSEVPSSVQCTNVHSDMILNGIRYMGHYELLNSHDDLKRTPLGLALLLDDPTAVLLLLNVGNTMKINYDVFASLHCPSAFPYSSVAIHFDTHNKHQTDCQNNPQKTSSYFIKKGNSSSLRGESGSPTSHLEESDSKDATIMMSPLAFMFYSLLPCWCTRMGGMKPMNQLNRTVEVSYGNKMNDVDSRYGGVRGSTARSIQSIDLNIRETSCPNEINSSICILRDRKMKKCCHICMFTLDVFWPFLCVFSRVSLSLAASPYSLSFSGFGGVSEQSSSTCLASSNKTKRNLFELGTICDGTNIANVSAGSDSYGFQRSTSAAACEGHRHSHMFHESRLNGQCSLGTVYTSPVGSCNFLHNHPSLRAVATLDTAAKHVYDGHDDAKTPSKRNTLLNLPISVALTVLALDPWCQDGDCIPADHIMDIMHLSEATPGAANQILSLNSPLSDHFCVLSPTFGVTRYISQEIYEVVVFRILLAWQRDHFSGHKSSSVLSYPALSPILEDLGVAMERNLLTLMLFPSCESANNNDYIPYRSNDSDSNIQRIAQYLKRQWRSLKNEAKIMAEHEQATRTNENIFTVHRNNEQHIMKTKQENSKGNLDNKSSYIRNIAALGKGRRTPSKLKKATA